jgi:hypothetical protein
MSNYSARNFFKSKGNADKKILHRYLPIKIIAR